MGSFIHSLSSPMAATRGRVGFPKKVLNWKKNQTKKTTALATFLHDIHLWFTDAPWKSSQNFYCQQSTASKQNSKFHQINWLFSIIHSSAGDIHQHLDWTVANYTPNNWDKQIHTKALHLVPFPNLERVQHNTSSTQISCCCKQIRSIHPSAVCNLDQRFSNFSPKWIQKNIRTWADSFFQKTNMGDFYQSPINNGFLKQTQLLNNKWLSSCYSLCNLKSCKS